MLQDFLGQELQVGDHITLATRGYLSPIFARVLKCTPQKVVYGYIDTQYAYQHRYRESSKHACEVVKVTGDSETIAAMKQAITTAIESQNAD